MSWHHPSTLASSKLLGSWWRKRFWEMTPFLAHFRGSLLGSLFLSIFIILLSTLFLFLTLFFFGLPFFGLHLMMMMVVAMMKITSLSSISVSTFFRGKQKQKTPQSVATLLFLPSNFFQPRPPSFWAHFSLNENCVFWIWLQTFKKDSSSSLTILKEKKLSPLKNGKETQKEKQKPPPPAKKQDHGRRHSWKRREEYARWGGAKQRLTR